MKDLARLVGRLKLTRLEAIDGVKSSALLHCGLDFPQHNFAPCDILDILVLKALYGKKPPCD